MKSRTVPLSDAKAKLSALINEVTYGGGNVVITSHGRPKAALVPLTATGDRRARTYKTGIKKALVASDSLCARILRRKGKWVSVNRDLDEIRRERS